MQVKELILNPVTTCTINTDVCEARDLMTLKKFSALPVVEVKDGKVNVRGIVSYHDLAGVYDDTINIQQVMTNQVHTVNPDTSVREAAKLMLKHKIHHLIVVDEGEIAGIISSLDIVKVVAES